ncbi:hypothetical protein AMTR_s00027p00074910 [Amborella trichopoda]|uniref:Uncharacterized protein n=1 Tax=Amborella trichopoda TaxID=13333 RepID=W1PTW0_AMBTC|nr:hypothetical protein AMTR_s00027p00074910 [Amborella trichopoda]
MLVQSPPRAHSVIGASAPSKVSAASVAAASVSASVAIPLVQEVSSSSEEIMPVEATFVVVSPIQKVSPSIVRSVEELALASSASPRDVSCDPAMCSRESNPSRMDEAGEVASGATDEGLITVQGKEPAIEEGSEQFEEVALRDEGPSPFGGEEPVFQCAAKASSEDVGDDGLSTA